MTVHDPKHPLYGQRFRVACWPRLRSGRDGEVVVFGRYETHIQIPIAALDQDDPGRLDATKLTCAAIEDLMAVMGAIEDADRGQPALAEPADGAQGAGARRSGGRVGGGDR